MKVKSIEKFNTFTPEQIHQIFDLTKNNNQIQGAFDAQKVLKKFFEKYKGYLKEEEYKEIIELLD